MDPIRSHDALLRFVFGDPAQMAELLQRTLPAPLVAAIDWLGLERIDGAFVDPDLSTRQADLLFLVPVAGRPLLLHVVVEHKSGADRWTALQLLRYRVRVWDRWQHLHPEARELPPVVGVVVHHGDEPWSAPRSVRQLVGVPAGPAAEFVRAEQPDAGFLLWDLAAMTEDELGALRLSVVADLTLRFLQFLRHRSVAEAAPAIARWQGALRLLLDHPRGQDVVMALFSWLLAGVPRQAHVLRSVFVGIEDDKTRQTMVSMLDYLLEKRFARGLRQGLEQGREQGREQGLLEGRRQSLVQLLELRFGPLPADAATRIAAAGLLELEQWTCRAVDAPTLPAVFACG